MASRVLKADWLLPIAGPAIRDGVVVVVGERISWLGAGSRLPGEFRALPVDRHPGVLTPGLVNAHTHLQYTGFAELGRAVYASFEHWAEAFEVRYQAVADPGEWRRAARRGADLAIRTGTTHLAEIVTDEPARGVLAEAGLGGIEYLEAIGHTRRTWDEGGRDAFLRGLDEPSRGTVGVSPHAPYSLDGEVVADLARIARGRGMRLHSHVGESSREAELYATGGDAVLEIYGPLRAEFELVRNRGAGLSTGRFAESVGLLGPDSHLAHAIYLDRDDRDLVRDSGTRIALCPRSNRVIGLDEPPVAAYLEEGHEIAIGTDSLASSPSLDLLGDAAALARAARAQGYEHDDLHARLMEAATRGGAAALGLSGAGVLEAGGRADLAIFDVTVDDGAVERALIERGEGTCRLTVIGGRDAYRRDFGGGSARPTP